MTSQPGSYIAVPIAQRIFTTGQYLMPGDEVYLDPFGQRRQIHVSVITGELSNGQVTDLLGGDFVHHSLEIKTPDDEIHTISTADMVEVASAHRTLVYVCKNCEKEESTPISHHWFYQSSAPLNGALRPEGHPSPKRVPILFAPIMNPFIFVLCEECVKEATAKGGE